MSTILRALSRRRSDREHDGDPEAILERNAAYREALRRRRPGKSAQRTTLVFSTFALVLAGFCVVVLILNWFYRPAPNEDRSGTGNNDVSTARGQSNSSTVPGGITTPDGPVRRPGMREQVKLRTRPLLGPSDASVGMRTTTDATPGVGYPPVAAYVTGPQPGVQHPPPTSTPPPGARSPGNGTGASRAKAPPTDPNDFLNLTGIVRDPKNPVALINDKIVGVGESIEGVKVLTIDNASYVQVEYQGKKHNLVLK